MTKRLTRIEAIEGRVRVIRPQRRHGAPDLSRLTLEQADQLRALNLKADAGGGLDCLTNDEVEVGLDLTCRLWNHHPDYHRGLAGEPYPWTETEQGGNHADLR